MNKYLPWGLAALAIIVLLVVIFSRPKKVVQNEGELRQLRVQAAELQREADSLRAVGEQLETSAREARIKDSLTMVNYRERLIRDGRELEILKKRANEKAIAIDTAGNDELRRILAN